MAIVKMRRLQLVAMSYDKDALLDVLQRTGAVEVVFDNKETLQEERVDSTLTNRLATVETALDTLCAVVQKGGKGEKEDYLQDNFEVTFSEFFESREKYAEVEQIVGEINLLLDEKNTLYTRKAKLIRDIEQILPYATLQTPFSSFKDTAHTQSRLGLIPIQGKESMLAKLNEKPLCSYSLLNTDNENVLFHIVCHKTSEKEINEILTEVGFIDCAYREEISGVEIYQSLRKEQEILETQILKNQDTMYALKDNIRLLKVYCDYVKFALEKEEISKNTEGTERTFFLHAYVPEEAESGVREAVLSVTQSAYMEFSEPTEEEEPPTLLKNNALVSNFESITNTFSVPNYREFDPNAIMSFFYSLFMGFIIGDAGYGFLMTAVGGWLWWKNRAKPSGLSKLAGAFAIGGVFAIFWGALFNSFFGFMLLNKTFMPNPQTDMWSLAGIAVPSVLIISMELGIFQLFAGYICKAVQEWRRGNIVDGICDGVIWAVFSIGVALAIAGFVEEAKVSSLGGIGAVMAGGSLLLAMITAGRKEKFFGKFTKGFGAVYGIINYASDVLSYARLYGLMLSGAVIASIIATYSGQFITSGNMAMAVLGVLLLVVGHGFNLVMNLLGAYIHDSRLQYVEFYGRFYEGEGTEFSPLGGKHKYIALTNK